MYYELTDKGKRMFPDYEIRESKMGAWQIDVVKNSSGYVLTLAVRVSEIWRLLEMGIIKEPGDIDVGQIPF